MSSLGYLTKLVPPETSRSVNNGLLWEKAEQSLSTTLDNSHKELVDIYGAGAFDGFLWIYSLNNNNKYIDIIESTARDREALSVVENTPAYPFPNEEGIRPEHLVSWGGTDNGDMLCLDKQGGSTRIITYAARGPYWSKHVMGVDDFIYGVLTRAIRVPHFPETWPKDRHSFTSHAA